MPDLPYVSILVAARNEETTIEACLNSLMAVSYPIDRFEILIGNDASTDRTASLVDAFMADKPHIKLIDVAGSTSILNGKANVLAQLASRAQGEFLFMTDADVRVPITWLSGMLSHFTPTTGIVTGTTLVDGTSLWARLQAVEWLLAFGLIHLGTRLNLPLTGSGNNMAVRRTAYEAVGGFDGIPFSVVEDYTLFQAIVRQGYGYAHGLNVAVLAHTLPAPTLATYLQQRKRWMRGAFDLPATLLGGVLFQYLLVPFLLLVALFAPTTALAIYLVKWMIQSTVFTWALQRTRQMHRWPDTILYEPYQLVLGTLAMLYYLLPIPIRWKGRTYT
ncbi:glycosyltransferase [Fibrella arboris]|uniref:glycosyltransferase n=1 Tax=Fibrella arboris TaxID=3242486 RepID=UPI003522291D